MKYKAQIVRAYFMDCGLPDPEMEYRFHPVRKWRFDFAFLPYRVALEVEGGIFIPGGGRHNRPVTMIKDQEKYNVAASMGWRVLKCQPKHLCMADTVKLIFDTIQWEMTGPKLIEEPKLDLPVTYDKPDPFAPKAA